jgi:phosphoglycolate phosphatase
LPTKIIIFDFDGTLADTLKGILETINKMLEHFGFAKVAESAIYPLSGIPLKEQLMLLINVDEQKAEEMAKFYRDIYGKIAPNTVKLFSGVEETLHKLKEMEMLLAIASSKKYASLKLLLDSLQISDYFCCVLGADSVENAKPHPEILQRILSEYNISNSEALFVGDSIFDIQMGKSAGVRTCAVTYGAGTQEALLKETPDFMINDFHELLKIVQPNG